MRIQFSLACQRGTVIPINYQSEVSNWIFEVLSKAGSELTEWAKHKGYDFTRRTFKHFTFSPLAIYPYEMNQERQEFKLQGNQVKVSISLYLDINFEHHVVGLFRQTPLMLGHFEGQPARFDVKHWQILPRPQFKETIQFKAVSPISVTTIEEIKTNNPFLMPDSETYDISYFTHAVRRFKAAAQYKSLAEKQLLDPSFPMEFRLIGQAKSRLIHLRMSDTETAQIRGFAYEFEVTMPIHLLEYCFLAGFGEYPYLGFGFVDLRQPPA
jgi:CRISPR-associated endoribonuclease Cas6